MGNLKRGMKDIADELSGLADWIRDANAASRPPHPAELEELVWQYREAYQDWTDKHE